MRRYWDAIRGRLAMAIRQRALLQGEVDPHREQRETASALG